MYNEDVKVTLTDKTYWDDVWSDIKLPIEVKKTKWHSVVNSQLDVIEKYLPKNPNNSILEIGGAPGQYLAYFNRKYGYSAYALDYSKVGCEKIRKNFELLNLDIKIFNEDLLHCQNKLPQFDIVYSLGVIEHFNDINMVISRHLDLVKPNGILVLGVPHFIKSFQMIFKIAAPKTLSTHNINALDIDTWDAVEKEHSLKVLFKGYIGGLELAYIHSIIDAEHARRTKTISMIRNISFILSRIKHRIGKHFTSNNLEFNSKFWSAYALAVYRK